MAAENFLTDILIEKQRLVDSKQVYYASLKKNLGKTKYNRYGIFKKQISQAGKIALIAEIKKASPSKGMIREDFNLIEIAKIYEKEKVAAISVLTEEKYFLGRPIYIQKVSDCVNVPVLTKDFIIDEGQIYEAWVNGASAVLLIVAILDQKTLIRFIQLATALDLDCLVEIHEEKELQVALDAGAEIIGINNRDLKTFNVDFKTCERIIPKISKGKIIVAESGIKTHEDVQKLKDLGAHAVLIGEIFMKEIDIGKKIREVMLGENKGLGAGD